MNMKQIRHRLEASNICRRCINDNLHTSLLPQDCRYYAYQSRCDVCGKMRNIVAELKPSGKLKTMFH